MKNTITDTETEKEIKIEAFCHTFDATSGITSEFSYCGVPRCECIKHIPKLPSKPSGFYTQSQYCPYCGLKNCPKCRKLDMERINQ